jgi:N-acyl-D-amino-acid deacylase
LKAKGLLAPWHEALEIGRGADIPVHFTHYRQRSQGDGSHLDYIGLVEKSRDEGLDVTFDCYPYVYGSTRANIWLPGWTMDGGPERLAVILDSPKERARLRQEMQARNSLGRTDEGWLTYFRKPENMHYEGRSLLDISRERGQDPLDTFLDLMRSEGHSLCAIMVGTNPQTLPAFVSHPLGMVGSDAILLGEYPSPRTYGCFPVILAEFVRAEKHLRLPEAIRKMTSFPAQRLGLRDRGLLRDGMKADVVVFDPRTVKATATPRQPKQFPLGIPYVIVNGKVVVDKGEHTGALPGRALRYRR